MGKEHGLIPWGLIYHSKKFREFLLKVVTKYQSRGDSHISRIRKISEKAFFNHMDSLKFII